MNLSRFRQQGIQRREFLKVAGIAGAGFAIGGVSLPLSATARDDVGSFGHFIKIGSDNTVTVVIKHLDKGQGVTTGLTAIVAEELDADWAQMRWEFAPADASRYNNLFWGNAQGTGGSSSIANSWMQLRKAGAAAKQMLVKAAADQWQVDAATILVADGKLSHASGKTASFGQLAAAASRQAVNQDPPLKAPADFKIIGNHVARIDSPEKTHGTANYTIDVTLPGMLYAAIAHPPLFGAVVKSVDKTAAMAIEGVVAVVNTARGVGVVADSFWTASQAKLALSIEWDKSQAEQRGSEQLWEEFRAQSKIEAPAVRNDGDVAGALNQAASVLDMTFEFPYLAHASMEPLNCAVQIKDGQCNVWTAAQVPTMDQGSLAQVTGLAPENIHIHTQLAGGSFGRRAVPSADYLVEAAMIAKGAGLDVPINLQWTREDDMQGGYYRPMAHHRFSAGLTEQGTIGAWQQRVVSQSILRGTPFAGLISGPVDPAITEGGHNLPYAIANLKVEAHEAQVGVPVLWWRSVGHTHNAYATEVFFDELARNLQRDPVALRLELLKDHPRLSGVLKLAADKANWGQPLPANKSRGVAVHESFNSYVAQVAEVTVNKDGSYKVDKIVCAVDCGIAVTPDVVKAQMEGGIGYGLGACLGEKITLADGKVEQANFYNYFPMRINQMPEIDVYIVPSAEAPTGVGEPGTPPAGPAVANALRKFLKQPLTVLPIGDTLDLA